jgi:hypothetical protein
MASKTVMVAPEGVVYERGAPQYATRERVDQALLRFEAAFLAAFSLQPGGRSAFTQRVA